MHRAARDLNFGGYDAETNDRIMARGADAILLAILAIALAGFGRLQAQSAVKQIPVPPPPMGWSSWNSFSNTIDSQIVLDQARAMIASGMAKAGYQYINIDEGWWLGERDAQGNIVVTQGVAGARRR